MTDKTVTLARRADPSEAVVTSAGSVVIGQVAFIFDDTTPFDEVMHAYERVGLALQEYLTSQGLA